jgi:pimeloyl-ACP methyl ester carboxylesterase
MPTARVNGIDIYYEVHGQGPRLTLIEGLGYHRWMWYKQVPAFSRVFTTLVYDNRGVGLTSKPPGPYSHEQNAEDLAGLLDHLGWERSHVLGVSMGGFIAQVFALAHPARVDRLVLVATGFGGTKMVPVPQEAAKAMMPDPTLSPGDRIRRAMPVAFGDRAWPDKHPDEFEQIVKWRLEEPQPPDAAMAQIMAGATFDVADQISRIEVPALVIAGANDGVVPPANSEFLAEELPNSRKEIIPEAGHLVIIEEADRFNQIVIDFLNEAYQSSPSKAAS